MIYIASAVPLYSKESECEGCCCGNYDANYTRVVSGNCFSNLFR